MFYGAAVRMRRFRVNLFKKQSFCLSLTKNVVLSQAESYKKR